MNKIYFFIFFVILGHVLPAQQSSLVLTGISRPNSPGSARSIELYVLEDIQNLSLYGFATSNSIEAGGQSNGAFPFPEASFSAGDFIYFTRDLADFENLHGFAADYELDELNFFGGNTSGPYCVVEILYSPDWDNTDLETIDFWASNNSDYIINGGWATRANCYGPNPGPSPWVYESPVFDFLDGDLLGDYANFNILEWTYTANDPDLIVFGNYNNECSGCTDELALEYDENASIDDGSCQTYLGCDDPLSLEYYTQGFDPSINTVIDDGSCLTPFSPGCTDSTACNYNSDANFSLDQCLYADNVCDTCSGETDGTGTVLDNDSDDDGICDADEANCNIVVSNLDPENLCEGNWEVPFLFQYDEEIEGLEGVSAIFTDNNNGNILIPDTLIVDTSSLYELELAYIISTPGNYTVSFDSNLDCPLPSFPVTILESIDVNLSYEIESVDCETGLLTVFLDGPSGIYSIYVDNEYYTDLSIGLDNIQFNSYVLGDGSDCLGNAFTSPSNHTVVFGTEALSILNVGDSIGAFYSHPSCGLISANNELEYQGESTALQTALWGDDNYTEYPLIEGFSNGQEVIWLLNSGGVIYSLDITWNTSLVSANIFSVNGLSQAVSMSIGPEYEESFDIELLPDSYNLSIYQNDCLISESNENIIEIIDNDTDNDGICDELEITGCTDPDACNYNESATEDNGLCEYESCVGCMEVLACNYDSNATIESEDCEYESCAGCMVETACNYDPLSTWPSDECIYTNNICDTCEDGLIIDNDIDGDGICDEFDIGCIDPTACNYDIGATTDDGSCYNNDVGCGCDNPAADEGYDCDGNCLDGYILVDNLCVTEQPGCIDPTACNYSPDSTGDDGSCEYIIPLSLDTDTAICDQNLILDAGSDYDLYLWSTGDTSQTIDVTVSGNYSVTVSQFCEYGEIEGFTYLNSSLGSNYYISNETASWEDANTVSQNIYQGHLATITSSEEQDFVFENVSSVINNNYWIGLSDINNEDDFEWVNGEVFDYSNWNNGEPNGGAGENYVEVFSLNSLSSGFWNDAPLINFNTGEVVQRYYVLEIECQCESEAQINVVFNICGCTDENADNYNSEATIDDESCIYYGCIFELACNYDPNANTNDGSCDYESCAGCTNPLACNYDPDAEIPSDTCTFLDGICETCENGVIIDNDIDDDGICNDFDLGCIDSLACNFNENATEDDGNCLYLDGICETCEDGVITDNDSDEDGVCDSDEIYGCTDFLYEEYDPEATEDDGSCLTLSLDGCTDNLACNYNENATDDDQSCIYVDGVCETCEDFFIIDNDLDDDGVCDSDEIYGCTDPLYEEYNPEATEDDGSCLTLSLDGCTDPLACNFNENATEDDGSCEVLVPVSLGSSQITTCNPSIVLDAGSDYDSYLWSTDDTTSAITITQSGTYSVLVSIQIDSTYECFSVDAVSVSFGEVGCNNPAACNYDENAECSNPDSCEFESCVGCMLEEACNYDPNALFDDGSCEYESCAGCLDDLACNYDSSATIDNENCLYLDGICETCEAGVIVDNDSDDDGVCDADEVSGCTDDTACNYDSSSTEDDGSCVFLDGICETCEAGVIVDNDLDDDDVCDNDEIYGCTDFLYEEYDPEATEDDGSCSVLSLIGCTDETACNYNPNATDDNESCIYADDPCEECFGPLVLLLDSDGDGVCNDDEIEGCQDEIACNYNENATDEGDCIYIENICDSCSGEIDGTGTVLDNDSDDDGVCDEDEIEGCLDEDACNYNPDATDIVVCLFADEVCEFCTDNGLIELLDADGDGICDEDEIEGCTDPLYEEYDPDATDDDGSCSVLTVYGCTDLISCNYDIDATDDDGTCEYINFTIEITQPCEQDDLGSITLDIDSLVLSDSLLVEWVAFTYDGDSIDLSDDSNSLNLNNLSEGIYTYSISNNICLETGFATIFPASNVEVLDASIESISSVTCFIDENADGINDITDGSVELYVTGGYPPYTYVWSNGITIDTLADIGAGIYSLTVIDDNGCEDVVDFTILEPDSSLSVSFDNTVDCFDLAGVPDGQISLTISGGTPPYSIDYDNTGDGNPDDSLLVNDIPATVPIYPLFSGSFDFTIQDANGCLLDTLIELEQNSAIDISYSGNPYNCFGDTNAFLEFVFSGGTPPYEYIITGPAFENGFLEDTVFSDGEVVEFQNLIPGDYFISCTDSVGCTQYSLNTVPTPTVFNGLFYIPGPNDDPNNLLGPPTSIVQVGEIDFTWSLVEPLECFGDSAAYINLEIDQGGDFISNTFNVYIDSSDIVIDTLVVSPESIDLEFCYYAPTNANAPGVLNPSYGDNFETDSINLLPGDIFGLFQQVTPNTQAESGNIMESGYMCVGGFPSTSQEGCSESYIEPMAWTDDMSSGGASQLIVWFSETATSNDGVVPPGSPSFINGDSENIVGFVQRINSDGDVEIYPTTINFNTTSVDAVMLGLGDMYFDNGTALALFQITSIIVGDEPVSGEGEEQTVCIVNPIYEDDYEFTVVDQYGCSQTIEVVIPTPQEPLNVNIVDSADYNGFGVSCNGNDDGFFSIVVAGGLGDYTVSLYDTLSEDGLGNLIGNPIFSNYCPTFSTDCIDIINSNEFDPNFNFTAGSYYITVTDSLGCSNIENGFSSVDLDGDIFFYYEIVISEPEILEASSSVTNVSCNGLSDGSVEIIITGGAPPYSINPGWTDSDVVEEYLPGEVIALSGFAIGDYQVSIEDANYCFVLHEFSITEPEELVISLVSVSDYDGFGVSCSGASDGDIEYIVTGGTPQFSSPIFGDFYDLFFLDENGDPGTIDPNTPNLPAGIYGVYAEDTNGCVTDTLMVELTEPDGMQLSGDNTSPSDYISDYNGYSVSCSSGSDGQIGIENPIEVEGGIGPFIYTWYIDSIAPDNEINPTWFGPDENSLDGIAEGVYILVISDLSDPDGCELELPPFVLDWPDPIGLSIDTIVDYDSDGLADFWADSIQFDTISIDSDQYVTGDLFVFGDYGVPCNGSSNGFINIDVDGSVADYFYQWEAEDLNGVSIDLMDQANNEDLDSLSAGIYTVIVTDQNYYFNDIDSLLINNSSECYVSQTFILEEPIDPLAVDVYVHQFTNNSFSQDYEDFVNLPDTVLYQDGDIIEYGISCFGDTTGLINIDISGGTGIYTYKLMLEDSLVEFGDVSSEDFISGNAITLSNQLSAGNYMLYVTDSNYNTYVNNYFNVFDPFDYLGCYFEMEIVITEPDEITITYDLANYNGYDVSCFGASDAFVDISVSGGIGNGQEYNYIYSWEGEGLNGQNNNPDINGISAGTYTLTVYDNLYFCQADTTITITTPDPIEFDLNQLTYSESCFNISCFIDENNDGINDVSDGQITVDLPLFSSAGLGFSHYWKFNDTIIDFDNNIPASLFPSITEMSNDGYPTGITGLSAGYYHLYVQDDSTGCDNIFGPIYISEPQLFSSNIDNVTISDFDGVVGDNDYNGYSVSCPNAEDGIITVEIEGGSGIYDVVFTYPNGETNQLSALLDPQPCEIDLTVDIDIDGDGIVNWEDNDIDGDGEYFGYGNSNDNNLDGIINWNEVDQDGDGIPDYIDNDIDGDGVPNVIDDDIDGDGVLNQDDDTPNGFICLSNCNNAAEYDFEGDCVANCSDNDNLPYYVGPMSIVVEVSGLSAGIYSISINDGSCQPLQVIEGIELIAPPEILVMDSDLTTEELDPVIATDVSCSGGSDGSILTNFFGGLPNNWNWGLYYSGTDSLVYIDNEPIVGVNLIEPSDIFIENLFADTFDLIVYDINGFYVTDENFANLGLAAEDSAGIYGVYADSAYLYFNDGCYAYQNNIIIHDPPPIDTIDFSIIHPCFDDSVQCLDNGSFSFDVIGDNSPFEVHVIFEDEISLLGSFENNVTMSNLECGYYEIIIQDANNCESIFDIAIGFGFSDDSNIPSPIINANNPSLNDLLDNINLPDCEFSSDGAIVFPDLTSSNIDFGFNYSWSAVDIYGNGIDIGNQSMNENLENLPIGIYSLHITDTTYSYCPVVIYDYLLEAEYDCPEVPTAFSPNGDGINDYWVIGSMEEYIDAEVQVFNRWGDLVFYSERNTEYWDGTYKGKKMPTADYFYIIKDTDQEMLSHGRVTLRR